MSIVCMSFSCHLQSTTSTFQTVLITDGSSSYAVFIYECGRMEWGGATIGWSETHDSIRETHSLSGRDSSDIGCTNSNSYSFVIYNLHSKCCLARFLYKQSLLCMHSKGYRFLCVSMCLSVFYLKFSNYVNPEKSLLLEGIIGTGLYTRICTLVPLILTVTVIQHSDNVTEECVMLLCLTVVLRMTFHYIIVCENV